MGGIRKAVGDWTAQHRLGPVDLREAAFELLARSLAEDKLAGILLMQEHLAPIGEISWRRDLPRLAEVFDQGHIWEWNTCDWLCVRVLGPMIESGGPSCAEAVVGWRHAPGLWRRRASVVTFENLAGKPEKTSAGMVGQLLDTCQVLVADPERFSQTAVGWVLRELSRSEPPLAGPAPGLCPPIGRQIFTRGDEALGCASAPTGLVGEDAHEDPAQGLVKIYPRHPVQSGGPGRSTGPPPSYSG